MAKIQNLFVYV